MHPTDWGAIIVVNKVAIKLFQFVFTWINTSLATFCTNVATIFCNHVCKLVTKIIASQKINTSHHSIRLSLVIMFAN